MSGGPGVKRRAGGAAGAGGNTYLNFELNRLTSRLK